jgi:hypothetical protein
MSVSRPSPAMLVAVTALVVSLGGNSYAAVKLAKNSVTSKTIRDGQVMRGDLAQNAVASAQVADGSLLAADFRAGQLPAGPQGVKGDKGDKGDPGHMTLAVRAATATGTATLTTPNVLVTAKCNPGEVATGGGAHSLNGLLLGDAPTSQPLALFTNAGITFQGYQPDAWSAAAAGDPGDDIDVTAWVVCATR